MALAQKQEKLEAEEVRGKKRRRTVNVGRIERNISMIGGAAMALGGLLNMKRRHFIAGPALLSAATMLLYRGKSGHCDLYQALGVSTAGTSETGLSFENTLTINRSPREVYEFWRNFGNLPRFMNHLESVLITGPTTSHWKAKTPVGVSLEWDAEMTEDTPERISWHSVGNADVPNDGTVEFRENPGGTTTELKVTINYYPPAEPVGKAAAQVLKGITEKQIEEDLMQFKSIIEESRT